MKKCSRCDVYVKSPDNLCPLCKELLIGETKKEQLPMYPEISLDSGKLNLLSRICAFSAFLICVSLFIINYATYHITPIMWSLISVAAILYGVLTIYYSILNNKNLASKILVQTIGACVLCLIVDHVIGYKGWSVNFIIPALILLSDLSIIILMLVNPMKRKTYYMYQITITIFSFLSFSLCFTRLIERREFAIISGLICLVTLVGSVIFGDKGFKNELIRRFHI